MSYERLDLVTSQIQQARQLLSTSPTTDSPWTPVGAALIAALTAILLAGVVVLGPAVVPRFS